MQLKCSLYSFCHLLLRLCGRRLSALGPRLTLGAVPAITGIIKPDGILVSVVSVPNLSGSNRTACKPYFFVEVTTARLDTITGWFARGQLTARVGTVLPLEQAHTAHEMLGSAPHMRGKIVLSVAAPV